MPAWTQQELAGAATLVATTGAVVQGGGAPSAVAGLPQSPTYGGSAAAVQMVAASQVVKERSGRAIKADALAAFLEIPISERCTRDPRCSKKTRHPARCKLDLPDNITRQRETEILAQNDLELQFHQQQQQQQQQQPGGGGFQQCHRNPLYVLEYRFCTEMTDTTVRIRLYENVWEVFSSHIRTDANTLSRPFFALSL